MSLHLGKDGQAKPLKKRIAGNKQNIAHVYDGANHIWPVAVIHFSDFTSVQLRYIWGTNDGRDLDTKSYFTNSPISGLNYNAVGFSWNSGYHPYLYWGGDNTSSGAECVMFNIEKMVEEMEDKMPDVLKMILCANWYGEKYDGNIEVECTAYKNGTIVHAWQLSNLESDTDTRGVYLFPLADGSIKMPDGASSYKDCWYGECIECYSPRTGKTTYHKINPVDDSIPSLRGVAIKRSGYMFKDGYAYIESRPNDLYKVWNNQINVNGEIIRLPTPDIDVSELADPTCTYNYCTIMLNSDGTPYTHTYKNSYDFRFGFVAGNSEFRGQQIIRCHVGSQGGAAQDSHRIGEIKYTMLNKIGELSVDNPILD